jgi:hypothetical protein
LVYAAGEAAIDQVLITGLQAGRPKAPSRRARERLVARLAAPGLTAAEIREVLRHRGGLD